MPPLDDDFLKERYDCELARKEQIAESFVSPVSVLILLGGLMITMVQGFSYSNPRVTWLFLGFVVLGGGAFVRSLWFFAKAYHGQTYELLPSVGALNEAKQKLIEYYEVNGPPPGPMDAQTDFEDNFRQRIMQATDRNYRSNINRQSCLHHAIVALFTLLVATALASVPFAVDQYMAPAKAPAVHIDNLKELKDSLMPNEKPASVPATRPSNQTAPPKPEFPQNTVTKSEHPVGETRKK